jgi:hypothetical protein
MHPSMKRIVDDVAEYGWHVVWVLAEGDAPEFAFSVGFFQSYEHPELVIFGLQSKTAHSILATCLERIQDGHPFAGGQVRSDILVDYSVAVLEIDKRYYREYLGSAIGFYDGLDFPALQLVWPDESHRFPWEPDCKPATVAAQPILSIEAS